MRKAAYTLRMQITIREATWSGDRDALQTIRTRVFVEEQSVPVELEWDEHDDFATHWLALDPQGAPIGTARMLRDGHIGRMAVLPGWRQQGVGSALLQAALQHARQQNLFEAYLYAQVHAVPFYQQAGFTVHGEEFMDANIPHLTMRLQLAERRQLGSHGGNFAPDNFSSVALDMVSQTEQHLRILSQTLDPHAFDSPEMVAAISVLARRSRFSDIRLLVVDTTGLVSRGHRLINLQRRLSSAIKVRRPRHEVMEIKDNLIIADQCGIICQSMQEPDKLWANYNNRPVAQTCIGQFDDWWERAIEDPELRQLEI